MEFKKVYIGDIDLYNSFIDSPSYINDNYMASELNFSNLFCWNVSDNITYALTDKAIYIKAMYDDGPIFLPPLVKRDEDFVPCLKILQSYADSEGLPFVVRSLTKEMVDVLNRDSHDYEITYNRDYSEYLYAPEDLITLVGKKFNQKRNHLNYFQNNYTYTARACEKKDRQALVNLVQSWKVLSGNKDILEEIAIDNAIAYYYELGLSGYVLEIDGEIAAFTMGFINRNNVGIVMFEKANNEIRGAYQAINNLFSKNVLSKTKFINRQEDMGKEGLRRAKESYNPVGLVDKFDLTKKAKI